MDPYREQKAAELTRAQSQCIFLETEYFQSREAFDSHHQESDFRYTMATGSMLLAALEDRKELEDELEEFQNELEEPQYGQQDTPYLPYSEFTFTTFNRYSAYVYLTVFGLMAFIALCVAIGW